MALISGQPEYTLILVKEDEFDVKGLEGYSVNFEKDNKAPIHFFSVRGVGYKFEEK